MNQTYYLTPGGRRRVQRRLAKALAAYKAVTDDNPEAMESGDTSVWHDNFAYEENQRQMHMLGRAVRDIRQLLATCTVVTPPVRTPDRVTLGTAVVFRAAGEMPRRCWIAGWDDGDPAAGRVSYNSPLGRALMGAEPGDVRELRVEKTIRSVELLDIGAIDPSDDDDTIQEGDSCAAA